MSFIKGHLKERCKRLSMIPHFVGIIAASS
jgi:hypothetical protein